MSSKTNYFALIGDLVGSRSIHPEARSAVQSKFRGALDQVNNFFLEQIKAMFLITTGDETQGLLYNTTVLYDVMLKIRVSLYPVKIVFGVGYGEITTDIGEYAVGADGPAFHNARYALEQAKKERNTYGKSLMRDVLFKCNEDLHDDVINTHFLALSVFREQWTDKQAQILMMLEEGNSQKDVSSKLKTPLSNISRTINRTFFNEYTQITSSLQYYLRSVFGSSS